MCLFCCDMLCWFSFITCCGCRDMVTRRLVFFPPEPYYDHIEPNEDFNDFYHRLSTKQDDSNDNNNTDEAKNSTDDNDENSDDIVLEIGSKSPKNKILKIKHKHKSQTNDNDNEREALNTSQENKINKQTYGVFRIRDDELNLRDFYWNNYSIRISNFESQYLLTTRGTTIPSYYIRNPASKYCILFSHGNAADIGLMRNHLCRMYSKCQISIFAYEYSGYGKSSGKPSEKNTYCDIETAYKYCIEILEIKPCHIILYGQSLGTGVSVYLASKYPVGGVILHSPLMSGLRVMQHFDKTYWFDIYPVINQIQHVFAPIFVIHGNKDKEIDIQHGKILSRIAPNSYQPWFVPYAGHNDIEVLFPDILFKKIKKFIKYLKNLEKSYNMKEELDIKQDMDNSDDDDDDHHILDICDEQTRDDTYKNECEDTSQINTYKRLNVHNITKSVTQKITDQSISPPPPQSIMTKSQDRMRQIALPSRKFSNTGGSMIDDEESVLKTPSVGGSLSMKDSNFISISMKDDKSTKGYDTNVLTPTMRTIHSKEQSTSEMLALPNTIDDSNTMSTFHFSNVNKKLNRKSRKNVLNNMSSHPDIDEEKESKIRNKKNRKRGYKGRYGNKLLKNEQRLNLPQSIHMKDNIKKCFQRRDKLLIQDINDDTSEDSSEEENVNENNNNDINDSDSSVDLQLDQNMNISTNKKKNDK